MIFYNTISNNNTGNTIVKFYYSFQTNLINSLLRNAFRFCSFVIISILPNAILTGSLSAMHLLTATSKYHPEKVEPLSREFWMRTWSRVCSDIQRS